MLPVRNVICGELRLQPSSRLISGACSRALWCTGGRGLQRRVSPTAGAELSQCASLVALSGRASQNSCRSATCGTYDKAEAPKMSPRSKRSGWSCLQPGMVVQTCPLGPPWASTFRYSFGENLRAPSSIACIFAGNDGMFVGKLSLCVCVYQVSKSGATRTLLLARSKHFFRSIL